MLASELIRQLKDAIDEYGDLPVVLNEDEGWPVGDVELGEDDDFNAVLVVFDVAH